MIFLFVDRGKKKRKTTRNLQYSGAKNKWVIRGRDVKLWVRLAGRVRGASGSSPACSLSKRSSETKCSEIWAIYRPSGCGIKRTGGWEEADESNRPFTLDVPLVLPLWPSASFDQVPRPRLARRHLLCSDSSHRRCVAAAIGAELRHSMIFLSYRIPKKKVKFK